MLIQQSPVYVVYLRVSTQRQGASGLGIDAQRASVANYVTQTKGRVLLEIEEHESGKKTLARPELQHALVQCRLLNATLLIAKLDRLARNVHFISGLMETGVPFVACDMPTATPFMLHVYAAMAEAEGIAISQRTKAALKAAKARGVRLGNPNLMPGNAAQARLAAGVRAERAHARKVELLPVVAQVRAAGVITLAGVARALEARGVNTLSGRGSWTASSVLRLGK